MGPQENILSNTELVLIELLRCFASDDSQPKLNIDSSCMDELFSLAKKHGVIGIAAYTLNKYGLFKDDEQKDKFMHEYDRTVMNMLSREASALALSQKLRELSIQHIFFKGMVVASAYPVAALRTYGDVDILIHPKDIKVLCEYMTSRGFAHSLADEGVVNAFFKNKEHYEFHTNLNVSNVKNTECFSAIWENASGEDYVIEFNHNFHISYLITHLEKHVYGSGAGVRMYLDIALYINKYKEHIDLQQIRDILSKCGLEVFLNTVLCICHKWFGLELPDWVIPLTDDVYSQMCEFTFSGGVFGDTSADKNAENALRQNMSKNKKNARVRFVLQRIFPSFSELTRLYPRYSGKPYLAPVAWINHLFRFFKDKKYDRVKVIASADVETAKQKKEFLESIGSIH